MKETRMPPAQSANLVANNGSTIYGVSVIRDSICDKNSSIDWFREAQTTWLYKIYVATIYGILINIH